MFYFRPFLSFCFLAILISISLLLTHHVNDGKIFRPKMQRIRNSIFINGSLLNELYIDRIEKLTYACNKYGDSSSEGLLENKDLLDHILVDNKHQLLYCYVPKVACTHWKRIFMMLNRSTNETDVLSIPANIAHSRPEYIALSNYTLEEARILLDTYTKFLFVRHPFERLLSAFRNKLEKRFINSKYFQSRLGRYIVKNYRVNPTNASLVSGDDVTFAEFTAYLTKSSISLFNEHWKPINRLCEPCKVQYDFIGKYESLERDSDYLLKSIGFDHIKFPTNSKPSSTSKDMKKYFKTLSLSTLKKLYDIYDLDFKLFSYDLVELLGYEELV